MLETWVLILILRLPFRAMELNAQLIVGKIDYRSFCKGIHSTF